MSAALHIDCDGEGCRERWNAASTNEERRMATAYVTSAEDVRVDYSDDDALYIEGWLELPEGWRAVLASGSQPTATRLLLCPACVVERSAADA